MSEDATEEEESTEVTESKELIVVYPRGETPYRDFLLEVLDLVNGSTAIVVTNNAESKVATDYLGAVKDRRVAIWAFKADLLAPLRQRNTDINDALKELLDPLDTTKKFLDGLILAFNEAERQKVRQAEDIERKRRELAELEGKPAPAPTPLPAQPQAVTRGEHTQSGERLITKYKVVDFAALPDDFKMQDTGKLTKAIKAGGMSLTIPGVRIFQERILATG